MTKIDTAVVMDWQLSSYFGWGVYGINLMLNWPLFGSEPLLTVMPITPSLIDINPIEWNVIEPALRLSRDLQAGLERFSERHVGLDLPVMHALGNDVTAAPCMHDIRLTGKPSIGITFFESTVFSPAAHERAKGYSLIVAGSSWNQSMLEHAGIGPTALTFQGVDPTAFHRAPKVGWFAGRFVIFSGGKLEYRKGQDLVLRAFRIFANRHSDALLVTAWASPWPAIARTVDVDSRLTPVCFDADGQLDLRAWVTANGIRTEQFIDLGAVPNSALPRLYREMDVGLFPNRCEGGTNLVAMECMACGVPVILSRNTGHLDLIAADRCFSLGSQSAITGTDHEGWGESDIEEIIEALETVRQHHADSQERAKRGAAFISTMTWADTVRQLTDVIAPYV